MTRGFKAMKTALTDSIADMRVGRLGTTTRRFLIMATALIHSLWEGATAGAVLGANSVA